MSKEDFTAQEFAARLHRAREAIAAAGLDWFLVIHPVSMRWLIGQDTKSYTGFQCLPVSAEPRDLVVFARELDRFEFEADTMADEVRGYNGAEPEDPMEAFARFAADLGLASARVGMEVPAAYLHPHHYVAIKSMLGDALVAEPSNLIHALKVVKSPRELEYHRRSASIAAAAWQRLVDTVAEGRSELELSGAAYQAILAAGSALPASTMNVMTGERTCLALGSPTERAMRRGDHGVVELGGAYRRYTSTLGRAWSLGPPGKRLVELHAIVREASAACMAQMKDGAPAIEGHEALKRVFVEAGVDRHRQHTSGYGMAPAFPPSWGEPTNMFGGTRDVLRAGMVMSVEPGLYLQEERTGIRLIDNCIITESGVELLSTTTQEIAVVD